MAFCSRSSNCLRKRRYGRVNDREEIVRAATEFAIERTGNNTDKNQVYAYIRVILLTCPEKNVKIKKLFI